MLSSLLGLFWSSAQFALIRQSITVRSVCHTSTQQADVAPSNPQIGADTHLYEPSDTVDVARAAARAGKAAFCLYLLTRGWHQAALVTCLFTRNYRENAQRKRSCMSLSLFVTLHTTQYNQISFKVAKKVIMQYFMSKTCHALYFWKMTFSDFAIKYINTNT